MANLICKLIGVRGRSIEIYDNKCIIRTEVTAGSLLTSNATDGEKTIFYVDCAGFQFKQSGFAIGYLQFETPSMQMNNQASNFFSENTFTFEQGKNGITNELMREVYNFVCDRAEGYKYGTNTAPLAQAPDSLARLLPRTASPVTAAALPDAGEPWTCSRCGAVNMGRIQTCQGCGVTKQWSMANAPKVAPTSAPAPAATAPQAPKGWNCLTCGTSNTADARFCVTCGSRKP